MSTLSQEIDRAIVKTVLAAASRDRLDEIIELGFSKEFVLELSGCNNLIFAILEDRVSGVFDLNPNELGFRRWISRSKEINTEFEMQRDLIKRGAPRELMKQFFGMHSTGFTKARKSVGNIGKNKGYVNTQNKKRDPILAEWKAQAEYELPERYLVVSKALDVEILHIWKVVQEMELIKLLFKQEYKSRKDFVF